MFYQKYIDIESYYICKMWFFIFVDKKVKIELKNCLVPNMKIEHEQAWGIQKQKYWL